MGTDPTGGDGEQTNTETDESADGAGGGRSVLGLPRRLGRLLGIGADDPVRRAGLTVAIVTAAFPGAVVAQTQAEQAGGLLCGTGLGQLIGLGFGLAAVFLLLLSGGRGTMAWRKIGSPRPDKKKEGREQLKGAGTTAVGAFVPAVLGLIFDTIGVGAFSCVDWGNIIGTGGAVLLPALPF